MRWSGSGRNGQSKWWKTGLRIRARRKWHRRRSKRSSEAWPPPWRKKNQHNRRMAVGDRTDFGLTAADRLRILSTYRNIAMVGLSSNPYAASSFAGIYLDANGYNIVPVNPAQAGKDILGKKTYASVTDVEGPVDIVDVFRRRTRRPTSPGRRWRRAPRCCGCSWA